MSTRFRVSIGIIVVIFALLQPIILNAFIAFLFAGIIPGTSIALPFWLMSLFLVTIAYIAIRWVSKDPIYIGDTPHQQQQNKKAARDYVLRKTTRSTSTKSRRPQFLRKRKRGYQVAAS
jgi:hypothetical protein